MYGTFVIGVSLAVSALTGWIAVNTCACQSYIQLKVMVSVHGGVIKIYEQIWPQLELSSIHHNKNIIFLIEIWNYEDLHQEKLNHGYPFGIVLNLGAH